MSSTIQPPPADQTLLRPQGRVLSTLEGDGSRRWMYPRLSRGRFWHWRRWTAYVLIVIFAAIPQIHVRGKPAILLDIIHRRFTLFGFTFLPTDTFLLALLMVSLILGIFFVTALFGRVWCGWACPQTVYMEFLFRPIERLCSGRTGQGGSPAAHVAAWRTVLRYVLYALACLFLAHTFLAYFVGVAQLRVWITGSPFDHPLAFMAMAVTTGLMLFDFCYFREQTCIIACPYGRFQSALIDRDSLLISYDPARGEPRGPLGRNQASGAGDCIDCTLCVQVCPTGIDIRDGLQFECIGCAQCIDACNAIMAKVGRPINLIRYASQAALAGQKRRLIRPRLLVYLAIMTGLVSLLIFLFATQSAFDVEVMRNLGRPFFIADDGRVANEFRVKLTNRSDQTTSYSLSIPDRAGFSIRAVDDQIHLAPGQMWTEPVEIRAPADAFAALNGAIDVPLRVRAEGKASASDGGAVIEQTCRLLGPAAGNPSTQGADNASQ
ncbi:MAG: cytochrome c oxidase accessory protein CcoG [Tepidisphaeraceae bacterium]|jgi:cytochrome c oxidase accessory protein FixG